MKHAQLLLVWYSLMSAVAARIERGPRNIAAQVGSDIELKCKFHHRSCTDAMWSKSKASGSPDILYVGKRVILSPGGRYSVELSPQRECTLHIKRLELADAGTFTCTEAVEGSQQIHKVAVVTVIESQPQLSMNATRGSIVDDATASTSVRTSAVCVSALIVGCCLTAVNIVLLIVCFYRRRTCTPADDSQSGSRHYETVAWRNEDSSSAYARIDVHNREPRDPLYVNRVPQSPTAAESSATNAYANVATRT